MANYSRERSRYGGYPGSIIIHSTPGLGSTNDPTSAVFRENLPAGYLKCDGSVQNAKDYYALAQILGVGDASRFRRENDNLRGADPNTGDLGQFRLPDLGSKVIIGGRGSGVYNNDFVDTEIQQASIINRVGPQIEVISNVGNRITAGYIGNGTIIASGPIDMLGSPKYNLASKTSLTTLQIENFQGHAHNSSQKYLNYTGNHEVGGEGGKDRQQFSANSGSGHVFESTALGGRESTHQHNITRPFSYTHNFTYSHGQVSVDMSGVEAYVDVDLSNEEKLDQLVTPFILVEYLIRF
jgi:hypothetical protein